MSEIAFDKYKKRGNRNWEEMMSRDPRVFNAYQQARYDWILKTAGDVKGKKVLDLGCGGGSLTYLLAKRGSEVIGLENEELGLSFAKKNLEGVAHTGELHYTFMLASAYDIPLPPESVDLVVNCEVIEHLAEPEKMLAEASRVLKKGGRIILTTPHKLTEFPKDPNHVKEFYPEELQKLMEKYFTDAHAKQTHHMLWRSLYGYQFRVAGRRPLAKWALNCVTLLTGWNPFMIDYPHPAKFDLFSNILAWGTKK